MNGYGTISDGAGGAKKKFKKKKLGLWGMIALTISMGGSQVSSNPCFLNRLNETMGGFC